MPKRNPTKTPAAQAVEQAIHIPAGCLDAVVPLVTPGNLGDVFLALRKALVERALGAELGHHLAQEAEAGGGPNHRNGSSAKTVLTDAGPMPLAIPRDRAGTFEPLLVPKHLRRLAGFDDKVIALYARGMTVRDIQGHLEELYAVEVSPQLIADVTDAVLAEVKAWQERPLEPMYPVVFFDCIRVKIRDEGAVRNKAVYVALGVRSDGTRDVLGLWIEQTEGAKFWLKVFNELRNRGVQDILVAVVDGLKGFPEAIGAAFPEATVQTCVVHLLRNALNYVGWQDRKAVAEALKPIYTAPDEAAALAALEAFEAGEWGKKFPPIAALWRRNWDRVVPFLAFPPEIRKVLYTTNATGSPDRQLRKAVKTRGHFPSDDAAFKLLWLALRNATAGWSKPVAAWKEAMTQFAILFGERFTAPRG